MAVRSEAAVELVLCRKFRTFKLSDDPRFEEKLRDVVGLYLDPPPPLHIHPGHPSVPCIEGRAYEMSEPRMPTTRSSAPGDPQGARQRHRGGTWLV